jgi:hypothetical protein
MTDETSTAEKQNGAASQPGTEEDTVDAPMIAVLGFIAAILAFVLILGLVVLFNKMQKAELERKYVNQPPAGLSKLQASQRALLAEYGYVDEKKGIVRIPIEDAMELVTKEYETAQKKPAVNP